MTFIATIVDLLFGFYIFVLFVRVILDLVRVVSPGWTPQGAVLVAANWTYALTDPPLRFLRRFIPPLPVGPGFAVDLAFIVLFFAVYFLRRLAALLFYGILM